MEFRLQLQRHFLCLLLIFAVIMSFFGFCDSVSAADSTTDARYVVVKLKNITAAKAKDYLKKFDIACDVSELPSPNTLLLTSGKDSMTKAASVLRLVDSEQPFVIKALKGVSDVNQLPKNTDIEAQIKDLSIGSFRDFPIANTKDKALIDMHKNQVVIIATEPVALKIADFAAKNKTSQVIQLQDVNQIQDVNKVIVDVNALAPAAEPNTVNKVIVDANTATATVTVTEANDVNKPNGEELLGELITSLSDNQPPLEIKEPNALVEQQLPQIPESTKADVNAVEPVKPLIEEPNKVVAEPNQKTAKETTVSEPNQRITSTPEPKDGFVRRSYEPVYSKLADEELELSLPEQLNIVDLIDLVGKHLDLDYMFDPAEVTGTVTLRVQGPIKVKELYPLLESVLKFRGFVMTRNGNFVIITGKDNALNIDPALLDGDITVKAGDVVVTRAFELQYISTAAAKALLDEMKLGASITQIPETKTLIITEYAFRMGRIEELLKMIDRPGEPKEFRFRQLKYTMAATLAQKVKVLVEQMGEISITVSKEAAATAETPAAAGAAARRAAPRPPAQPLPEVAAETTKPSVYLDADERTNRILMIGLADQLAVVERFVDSLDVSQQDLRSLKVYVIQNIGAEEIQNKLVELGIISATERQSTSERTSRISSQRRTQPARTPAAGEGEAPAPMSAAGGEEVSSPSEEPQVVLLESTNSLLVNATPEQHIRIATIIGYVDVEPDKTSIPYVVYALENQSPGKLKEIIDQLVKETIEGQEAATDKESKIQPSTITNGTERRTEDYISVVSDANTYSLIVYANKKNQQWISSLIKELDEYRPQVLLNVTLVDVSKQDDFNYDLNIVRSFPDLTNTSGFTGTLSGPGTPTITKDTILTKLLDPDSDRNRYVDFQSDSGNLTGFYGNDKVMALLTAMQTKKYGRIMASPKLLVDDNQEGTIETKTTTYITRTSTIVNPGTSSGTSSTITDTKFDPYDASIKLMIKPHISKGDNLRLEIEMVRSDFLNFSSTSEKPPDKAESNVNTVVTVPDGYTIILGGMDKVNQSKGGTKVPLLGDIPIVGGLFRSTSNVSAENKLYVFVKANILRPGTDLSSDDLKKISKKYRNEFEKKEAEMQKYNDVPGIPAKPMDPNKVLKEDEEL